MKTNHLPQITIFGGSGFLGTQIVQLLARKDCQVRVAVRRPDLAGQLRAVGTIGQVVPIQANLRFPESVRHAARGSDIVINLVGVGYDRGKQSFDAVHIDGARAVAEAAAAEGIKHLVHVSAIGADPNSPSAYARSKGLGEAAVMRAFPSAVILRPSIVFGRGDGFFNLLGTLSRYFPVLPLIGGKTRFQPVFVGDAAEAVALAAEGRVPGGRVYELGGPNIETHRQLFERVLDQANRRNPLIPVSQGIGKLMAAPFSVLPFPPLLTKDQVILLGEDNVVSAEAEAEGRTFAAFGITPKTMSTILPSYLWRFRKHGQYDKHTKRERDTKHSSEGTNI